MKMFKLIEKFIIELKCITTHCKIEKTNQLFCIYLKIIELIGDDRSINSQYGATKYEGLMSIRNHFKIIRKSQKIAGDQQEIAGTMEERIQEEMPVS